MILSQQYSLLYSTDIRIRKFLCCFIDSGVSQDVKPEVMVSKRELDIEQHAMKQVRIEHVCKPNSFLVG